MPFWESLYKVSCYFESIRGASDIRKLHPYFAPIPPDSLSLPTQSKAASLSQTLHPQVVRGLPTKQDHLLRTPQRVLDLLQTSSQNFAAPPKRSSNNSKNNKNNNTMSSGSDNSSRESHSTRNENHNEAGSAHDAGYTRSPWPCLARNVQKAAPISTEDVVPLDPELGFKARF